MGKIPFHATLVSRAIMFLLNDAKKKGLIEEVAEKIDEIADKNLERRSEEIQIEIIQQVLIPLMRALTKDADKETKHRYCGIIASEFARIDQELRRVYQQR